MPGPAIIITSIRVCSKCEYHLRNGAIACPRCYRTCSDCGAAITAGHSRCASCKAAWLRRREAERFANAKKVSYGEYEGPWLYVSLEHCKLSDLEAPELEAPEYAWACPRPGYFKDLDDLLEHCKLSDLEAPEYAWACTGIPLQVDIESALVEAIEDAYDGAGGDVIDQDELRAFVGQWNAKQTAKSYEPDFSIAVLLPKVVEGAYRANP